MDALALLCTLHADGPASLRILRRAGLSTVAAVGAAAPERIVELLGMSPSAAGRFVREARSLAVRAGDAPLQADDPQREAQGNRPLRPERPELPRAPLLRRAPREAQDSESLYTLFCELPPEPLRDVEPKTHGDRDDVAGPFA